MFKYYKVNTENLYLFKTNKRLMQINSKMICKSLIHLDLEEHNPIGHFQLIKEEAHYSLI